MIRWALAASVAAAAGTAAHATVYFGSGGTIPDFGTGTFTSVINVGDPGVVGTFNGLTLGALNHPWVGDIRVTLTLPDATVISIVDRIGYPAQTFGDSSNYGGDYTFADGGFSYTADGNIWTEAGLGGTSYTLRSGVFAASGAGSGTGINLQALIGGKSVSGAWTLTIEDLEAGDIGSLGSWSIDLAIVPAPGALALLGLAGMTCRNRRR